MSDDSKADDMRRNAENCAEMAQDSKIRADKARFKRMEGAWSDLAKTQDWLEGRSRADRQEERGA